MNTRCLTAFKGTVAEWLQAARKEFPNGHVEYCGILTLWVHDGVDVACHSIVEAWIKEKF